MVTGRTSFDTVGPDLNTKRRRRKEQLEEDDSSDLSDESDEDELMQREAQKIRFNKMPVRNRAGSSPLQNTTKLDGPSLLVTSPSRPPESHTLRRGSLSTVDAVKERARRDTVTSSEMSSENEQLDPSVFKRKHVNRSRAVKPSNLLSQRINEDAREDEASDDEVSAQSVDSTLDSDFEDTVETDSLLGEVPDALSSLPDANSANMPPAITPHNTSPKKSRQPAPLLQALPPPRPVSTVLAVSALTQALKAKDKKPESPFQRFATLSGKGEPNPFYIKVYAPFSKKSTTPFEMLVRKRNDDGTPVTVGDAIGFALWRYAEEGLEPPIRDQRMNVNKFVFRMMDDDEVDYEFPPFDRVKPLESFASNNTRPARGRSRDKPWDEFALVEASPSEFAQNEKVTPVYSKDAEAAPQAAEDVQAQPTVEVNAPEVTTTPTPPPTRPPPRPAGSSNPILGRSFVPQAQRKDSTAPLDQPTAPTSTATPRTGAATTITVRYVDTNFSTHTIHIPATTDTYIAEIFDKACRDLKLDKGLFVLKVSGTQTVAPSDRTVEALGNRTELDLQRRRFIGDGNFGLTGSPGSDSPNAPLQIEMPGTPKKHHRKGLAAAGGMMNTGGVLAGMHPLAQKQDALLTANSMNYWKRWPVTRKQPMSFSSSSARILALDGEYMLIMPAETGGNAAKAVMGEGQAAGKTTTVHFSSVVHSKVSRRHPRAFRVVVFKERETKRYDFEAQSEAEAQEIVSEIKKGVERFQEGFV